MRGLIDHQSSCYLCHLHLDARIDQRECVLAVVRVQLDTDWSKDEFLAKMAYFHLVLAIMILLSRQILPARHVSHCCTATVWQLCGNDAGIPGWQAGADATAATTVASRLTVKQLMQVAQPLSDT